MRDHLEIDAPQQLRHAVKCFWHERRDAAEGAAGFEVLPDGYPEIIFHAGGRCSIVRADGRHALPSPFVMGLLDGPVRLHADAALEIVGIRCHPWSIYALLGLPSGRDEVLPLAGPLASLQPAVAACLLAGRPRQAFAVLASHLRDTCPAIDGMLAQAGGAIRAAGGALAVTEVATAAHATVRTLERRFKHASGRSVKDVAGLVRFEQARNRLWLQPDAHLADLAQECGYTDQSHLSREFKRYSGVTPAAFAQGRRRAGKA